MKKTYQFRYIEVAGERLGEDAAKAAGIADAKQNIPSIDEFDAKPGFINKLVNGTERRIKGLLEVHGDELGKIDGRLSHAFRRLQEIGTPENREIQGRIPTIFHNMWLYVGLLLVLGVAEVVLNSVIFEIMGEGQLATYVTAVGLTGVLFVMAHISGVTFRQRSGVRAMGIVIVSLIAAVLVLWVVAVLRVQFLRESGVIDAHGGNWAMLYYGLNLFLFAAAFAAAVTHRTEIEALDKQFAHLQEERHGVWSQHRAVADQLNAVCLQLCAVYREHNDRERGQMAKWTDPILRLPDELQQYQSWSPATESTATLTLDATPAVAPAE